MTKDYFKRLTTIEFTAWDLNCRFVVPHNKRRNKLERILKRRARRRDKKNLKKVLDSFKTV